MQNIIIERPYRFVPPHRGTWIPALIRAIGADDWYLRRYEGVVSHEIRGIELLQESLRQGCSLLLAPNHSRYADPIVMGWLAEALGVELYTMASWHLFNDERWKAWAIRLCGGFSIYREGVDKQALDTAIEILVSGERPLVIFPEGTVYHTNDLLHPLLEGTGFVARMAARRRAKAGRGPVAVHPVALKYLYKGDVQSALEADVAELERRLTWEDQFAGEDLLARVLRIGEALLCLREIQFLGVARSGCWNERKRYLITQLLEPLEQRYLQRPLHEEPVITRIKRIRAQVIPLWREARGAERKKLWNELRVTYVAQIVYVYDDDYLAQPTDTRVLETIERFQEDVTDKMRRHRPMHCIVQVGEPILTKGERAPHQEPDPLMTLLAQRLQHMLDQLSAEARPWPVSASEAWQQVRGTALPLSGA